MPLSDIVHKYRLAGTIIHAGAHLAQEKDLYRSCGLEPVYWIEAIPELAKKSKSLLQDYSSQTVLEGALWSHSGKSMLFNLSSNKLASSSFLRMGLHKIAFPEVSTTSQISLTTVKMDDIPIIAKLNNITLLVLDIQGAELEALKGAEKTLAKVSYVFTEVSILALYKNQPTFSELHTYLEVRGFSLLEFEVNDKTGHGNALFGKNDDANQAALAIAEDLISRMKFSFISQVFRGISHEIFRMRRKLNEIGIPLYLMRRPGFLKRKSE
jgi:FkbM family methyltransferase